MELPQNMRHKCDEKELFAVFPSLFLPQKKEEKEMESIWTGVELSSISFWQHFFIFLERDACECSLSGTEWIFSSLKLVSSNLYFSSHNLNPKIGCEDQDYL